MVGVPFLHTAELLQHPERFVSSTYLSGVLALLALALLWRIFTPGEGKLASVFAVLSYYLLVPDWMRLLAAPLAHECGNTLLVLACWLILRGRVAGFTVALGLLLWAGKLQWLNTAGLLSLSLAALVFLLLRELSRSRFWRSLSSMLRIVAASALGYALFLGGELELNRRLIVPFQRETHTSPLRLNAPTLAWMTVHDSGRLGLLPEEAAVLQWLAGQSRASALVYTPLEPFESAQTNRIYSYLSANLSWCGWRAQQPNWGLNWIRQGGAWGGCGVDYIVVRGGPARAEPAFRQGSISVYRNQGARPAEQPAHSLLLASSGQPGGPASWDVAAAGPVVAVEDGQLPFLVLKPGRSPFRLPWESPSTRLQVSGGLALSVPALSLRTAWRGLRLTDLDRERKLGCSSIAGLHFGLHNGGRMAVDLSGMRGVQLLAPFSPVQPVFPLAGVVQPGQTVQLEIPWNSPPRPVKSKLDFYWVDAQGDDLLAGRFPVRTWYRVAPAQYYDVGLSP